MIMEFESDAKGAAKLKEYLASRPGEIVLDGWKYLPSRAVEQLLEGKQAIKVVAEQPYYTVLAQQHLRPLPEPEPEPLLYLVAHEDASVILEANHHAGAMTLGASALGLDEGDVTGAAIPSAPGRFVVAALDEAALVWSQSAKDAVEQWGEERSDEEALAVLYS